MEAVMRWRKGFATGGYVKSKGEYLVGDALRTGEYWIERKDMDSKQKERIRMAAEALEREMNNSGVDLDIRTESICVTTLGGPAEYKHHIRITKKTEESIYP